MEVEPRLKENFLFPTLVWAPSDWFDVFCILFLSLMQKGTNHFLYAWSPAYYSGYSATVNCFLFEASKDKNHRRADVVISLLLRKASKITVALFLRRALSSYARRIGLWGQGGEAVTGSRSERCTQQPETFLEHICILSCPEDKLFKWTCPCWILQKFHALRLPCMHIPEIGVQRSSQTWQFLDFALNGPIRPI